MKNHGKDICEQLKSIRRDIARENNIPLDIPECNYKGECDGTCPRCEAELQYLEQELSCRSAMGKAAMVAGMAVGLTAGSLTVSAQKTVQKSMEPHVKTWEQQFATDSCLFIGSVKDSDRMEPLVYANVLLTKNGVVIASAKTDWEGNFSFKVPKGKYVLKVSYVGYNAREVPVKLTRDNITIGAVLMTRSVAGLVQVNIMAGIIRESILDVDSPESGEKIDADRIIHMPTP